MKNKNKKLCIKLRKNAVQSLYSEDESESIAHEDSCQVLNSFESWYEYNIEKEQFND